MILKPKATGQASANVAIDPARIPEELLRSIPRDCRLTGFGKFAVGTAVTLIIGAIAFGVGVYLVTTRNAALKKEMAEHGETTTGVVVRTYRAGDENNKRDVFLYQFDAGGKTYSGRTDVGVRNSPRYHAGSELPVRYLPVHPQINWMDGRAPRTVPLFTIPLFVVLMLGGAYGIFWGVRRQRMLVSEGRAALARIKEVKRLMRGEHKKQRAYIEFAQLNGAHQEAHVDFGKKAPQAGSTMVVLYDPDNPSRVLCYPASLVRVAKPEAW
jgi:hypothetical protein